MQTFIFTMASTYKTFPSTLRLTLISTSLNASQGAGIIQTPQALKRRSKNGLKVEQAKRLTAKT